MRLSTLMPAIAAPAILFLAADSASAQLSDLYKLERAEQPAPKELAEPIRQVLAPAALRLLEDGEVFYEFWFRKEIPLAAPPADGAFCLGAVKEGTLLGALKVHEERYDFKDEEIPPGVYTLRLGLQPQDGDHLGTSPTPTFALLIPAKDDKELDGFAEHEKLSDASRKINAAEHPSNLSLQRLAEGSGPLPRLATDQRKDWEVVCMELKGVVGEGGQGVPLTFSLVFEGIGDF